jgi:hypothetical protein
MGGRWYDEKVEKVEEEPSTLPCTGEAGEEDGGDKIRPRHAPNVPTECHCGQCDID